MSPPFWIYSKDGGTSSPDTLAKSCELTERRDREENKTNLRLYANFKPHTSEITVELGYNGLAVRFCRYEGVLFYRSL